MPTAQSSARSQSQNLEKTGWQTHKTSDTIQYQWARVELIPYKGCGPGAAAGIRSTPPSRYVYVPQAGRLAKRSMSPTVCTQGNASSQNISRAGVIDFGSSRVPTLRTTTPGRVPGSWAIDEPHFGQKCRSRVAERV